MASDSDEYREWAAHNYSEQVAKISGRLRSLADDIDRHGKPRETVGAMGVPRFLSWGVANLNAEYLVTAASAADHAEAGETGLVS